MIVFDIFGLLVCQKLLDHKTLSQKLEKSENIWNDNEGKKRKGTMMTCRELFNLVCRGSHSIRTMFAHAMSLGMFLPVKDSTWMVVPQKFLVCRLNMIVFGCFRLPEMVKPHRTSWSWQGWPLIPQVWCCGGLGSMIRMVVKEGPLWKMSTPVQARPRERSKPGFWYVWSHLPWPKWSTGQPEGCVSQEWICFLFNL